jgi:protein phosphatase
MVRTGEIAACIARLIDPELVCEELVTLANSRGGPDNITVVVARIDGLGLHRMRSAAGPQDAAAVQHEGD